VSVCMVEYISDWTILKCRSTVLILRTS
jgi:hypothetical protein